MKFARLCKVSEVVLSALNVSLGSEDLVIDRFWDCLPEIVVQFEPRSRVRASVKVLQASRDADRSNIQWSSAPLQPLRNLEAPVGEA
jgi:hypothetical protein